MLPRLVRPLHSGEPAWSGRRLERLPPRYQDHTTCSIYFPILKRLQWFVVPPNWRTRTSLESLLGVEAAWSAFLSDNSLIRRKHTRKTEASAPW